MAKYDIYIDAFKPEVQAEIKAFLGDNGNYDVMPILTLEKEPEYKSVPFVKATVKCYATYKTEIELPEEFFDGETLTASDDEVLTYVRMHLPEANVSDLEYLSDLEDICEAVWQDDVGDIFFKEYELVEEVDS